MEKYSFEFKQNIPKKPFFWLGNAVAFQQQIYGG